MIEFTGYSPARYRGQVENKPVSKCALLETERGSDPIRLNNTEVKQTPNELGAGHVGVKTLENKAVSVHEHESQP